jgi:hypothetical protein
MSSIIFKGKSSMFPKIFISCSSPWVILYGYCNIN